MWRGVASQSSNLQRWDIFHLLAIIYCVNITRSEYQCLRDIKSKERRRQNKESGTKAFFVCLPAIHVSLLEGSECGGRLRLHINYSSYKLWITKGSHWRLIFHMKYDRYYSSPLFLDLFMAIYLFRRKKIFSPCASGLLSDGRAETSANFFNEKLTSFLWAIRDRQGAMIRVGVADFRLAHEHANDLSTARKQTTRKNEWCDT